MKKGSVVLAVLIAIALVASVSASTSAAEYNYVGVKGCKICHMTAKIGEQFKIWEKSKHSEAYKTLASEEAMKIGQEKGIENPQESPECLKCHETGYGLPDSRFESTYNKEDGVGCESCHGPGSAYKKITIMKNLEEAKANGLIIPDEATCKKCHNEESPTFKGFNYDEMVKKIAHPIPESE